MASKSKGHSNVPEKIDQSREPQDNLSDFTTQIEKRIGNLVQGKAKEQVVSQVLALVREEFSGPIPHPRHLNAYEAICPGAADRILRMAEIQLDTQAEIAKAEVKGEQSDRKAGMWMGFGALLALVVAAVFCAAIGQQVIAGSFIGVGALGTNGRFISGRNGAKPQKTK